MTARPWVPNAWPLHGELGCAHGIERGRNCRRCKAETDRVDALVEKFRKDRDPNARREKPGT